MKLADRRRDLIVSATKTGGLPAQYQEVEYIQSSGTQYIDTGVLYDSTSNYEVFQDIEELSGDSVSVNYGSGWNAGGAVYVSYYNRIGEYFDGSRNEYTGFRYPSRVQCTIEIIPNSTSIFTWKKGEQTKVTTRSNTSLGTYAQNTHYPLLGVYTLQHTINTAALMKAKLYGASIKVNNNFVREFIPCYRISDTVAGMYDMVNDVFYTNAGTGSFGYKTLNGIIVQPT